MNERESPQIRGTIFGFEDALRREGRIRLRIYELPQKTVVIVTDLDKGPSVTNAAEEIATQVVSSFGIDPERHLWFEHYPREDIRSGKSSGGEEYDLVTFTWDGEKFTDPRWSYSTQQQIEELIGERL
jgi:hypothetical protein